jgi:D-galacturonate reductase
VTRPQVTVVGGGMITHDQILPSLYHLQREGAIGDITVCAQHGRTLRQLANTELFARAFPGQSFRPFPAFACDPDQPCPELYLEAIRSMTPRNVVAIALPDQLHADAVLAAIEAGQHVISVKPLVLKAADVKKIEREAFRRGLFVGVEYHKRFDYRNLMARKRYREGLLGEFVLGTACLLEKWHYRHSNFQNWCTAEHSDAFTYIGCHYVDLVHFITGLMPVAVSVYGIRDQYPNGKTGFLWTDARVIWNNDACLNVQNTLGYPDQAPGSNTQGLTLYCKGGDAGAFLSHSDQSRGISCCYLTEPDGAGSTLFAEPNPDYFEYVDQGTEGLVPVGYGYRSIEFLVNTIADIEERCAGLAPERSLAERQLALREIDEAGIIATPANSAYNELVIEAGRSSILDRGKLVPID